MDNQIKNSEELIKSVTEELKSFRGIAPSYQEVIALIEDTHTRMLLFNPFPTDENILSIIQISITTYNVGKRINSFNNQIEKIS